MDSGSSFIAPSSNPGRRRSAPRSSSSGLHPPGDDRVAFPEESGGSLLHGHGGIAHFEQTGADATATSIRLRRFPRLGRAVFGCRRSQTARGRQSICVPIPKARIDSESAWIGIIASSVEGRAIHSGSGAAIPENLFPMEVEDTTRRNCSRNTNVTWANRSTLTSPPSNSATALAGPPRTDRGVVARNGIGSLRRVP